MDKLGIFNTALSGLGHERTLASAADACKEARLCELWWPVARRAVLGAAFWPGLAKTLGPLRGTPDGAGRFLHAFPPDCWLRYEALDASGRPAALEADGGCLAARVSPVCLRHVEDGEDAESWPAGVAEAVSAELAARIALPLTGQRRTAEDARAAARHALSEARARHAQALRPPGAPDRYAAARRGGAGGEDGS
jgi:hypothetical protein